MEIEIANGKPEKRSSFDSGSFQVRVASTTTELKQIYRFRYKIRVESMKKHEPHADHSVGTIVEPLDLGGLNFGIWVEDELVACARLNFGYSSDISYYVKHFKMELVEGFSMEKASIGTKLMVAEHYRNSRLNVLLMQACCRYGMENGADFCVIESRDELLRYYGRFGFKPYTGKILSEYYGELTPVVLHLSNLDHLIAIKSPLLPTYYEVKSQMGSDFGNAA